MPFSGLYALINNAGIMIIGNYEWQTIQMVEHTINVNLLGAMRVVSAFLPDLRKSAIESRHQVVLLILLATYEKYMSPVFLFIFILVSINI